MTRQVLVIEDEPSVQRLVSSVLRVEGYEVRAAKDGQEALDMLEDWLPDLIILDLMMPVMDGRTFRASQLELGRGAEVPLIILTAHHLDRSASEGLGAAVVLAKPFEFDDLLGAVTRCLGSDEH